MSRLSPNSGMSSLSPNSAHLYLASPDEWTREPHLSGALAVLSSEERERYERFRVAAPARSFLTGRALVRRVLSLHAGVPAEDWRLLLDQHGRPRIEGPEVEAPLEFNLTHNDETVACLVTPGSDGGVDVESLDRKVEHLGIAEHSFAEEEVEDLRRLEGEPLSQRFFSYWTLKEAYLKARGIGIAMRLDSAVFALTERDGPDGIAVRFAPRAEDREDEWQFTLYRLGERQRLAVALRRVAGTDLGLRVFESTPENPRATETELELLASTRPISTPARETPS